VASDERQVYGLHAVRAVLERRPETLVAAHALRDAGGKLGELVRALASAGLRVAYATRPELDRLAGGGVHQGIVVEVGAPRDFSIADFESLVVERARAARLLVLDGVEDPRNLGACLRTADAAGIDAVVVPKDRSARLTAVAVKTSTGAAETVPVFRAPNLARTLAWLKEAGVWVVGADAAAERSLYATKLAPPVALVLGGEGRGVRRLTRELCDELVFIPMAGSVESLNVSVATGIVLFELLRQAPKAGPAA
jgi:23S rRNA (guanosine2251-2'-O)-methyltransferase